MHDFVKCIDLLQISANFQIMLLLLFRNLLGKFPCIGVLAMKKTLFIKFLFLICAFVSLNFQTLAQTEKKSQPKSQEVSEADGIPVLIKHLPEWENVRNSAVLTQNVEDLRKSLGERPIYDLIDFAGGTEAVTAVYVEGKLLIIEYSNPQSSVEMDGKTQQRLVNIGQTPQIFYRRIGNYNAFVFDAADESAANVLFDQIKYEKQVQWLGENPYLIQRAERAVVQTLSSLFVSTVLVIVTGIIIAIFGGLLVGVIYFRMSQQKRAGMQAFSDAGGMTRLNLDELT